MIKNCLKFLLCVTVYAIAFMLAGAILPFSQGFIETSQSESPAHMLFMIPQFVWNCFVIYFIVRHTRYTGIKLFARMLYVMFFAVFFITFVGALYSLNAFDGNMTMMDMISTMIIGLFSLPATIPLILKFFQNKDAKNAIIRNKKISIKTIMSKLAFCGIAYLASYFLFALFFQWPVEEFRMFYWNTPWGQAAWNGDSSGIIPWLSITAIRGVLNGLFILPMLSLIDKSKITFITGICLIYVTPAFNHFAPNPMFPDIVRVVHLVAMTGSMLLFGIVAGNILWGNNARQLTQSDDGVK